MRKELVFNNGYNNYTKAKYYFQKDKKAININDVDTKRIVLSNKTPYGKQGASKYYIAYLIGGFTPLHIAIKNTKLYANVLANDNELLKYIEIWNKVEALFNRKFNKKGFYSKPVYNEYINTKMSPYNENFHDFEKLTKDEYCGHSILFLDSICEVENKYYHLTFLNNFFEKHHDNNVNNLFKELVQIIY